MQAGEAVLRKEQDMPTCQLHGLHDAVSPSCLCLIIFNGQSKIILRPVSDTSVR